jgi:hypothetical protein
MNTPLIRGGKSGGSGSGSDGSGRVSLTKNIVGSQVGFGSIWSRFGRVSGRILSSFFGSQVISDLFGSSFRFSLA